MININSNLTTTMYYGRRQIKKTATTIQQNIKCKIK